MHLPLVRYRPALWIWALVLGLPARCAAAGPEPECAPPNVLIVLDVSGSMNAADKPDGKYAAAVTAIDTVVRRFESTLRFGLMVFPDPGIGGGYCSVSSSLAVEPALGTAGAIREYLVPGTPGFFGGPKPHFDTPMKQALDVAGSLPALRDPTRRSHILLITDGMQDCCRAGDYDDQPDCLPRSTTLDPVEAAENRLDLRDTVAALAQAGLPVFVVGFGSGVDVPALNGMAVAARTALPGCNPQGTNPGGADTCFYPVGSSVELISAMSDIAIHVGEEVCDGIDNDCDGLTDEDFDVGAPCDGDDEDDCADGRLECDPYGGIHCVEVTPEGRVEVCDGIDNDCDGLTDEDTDIPCESACGRALRRCVDGVYGPCEPVTTGGTDCPRDRLPEPDAMDAPTDEAPTAPDAHDDCSMLPDQACTWTDAGCDCAHVPHVVLRDPEPRLRLVGGCGCRAASADHPSGDGLGGLGFAVALALAALGRRLKRRKG